MGPLAALQTRSFPPFGGHNPGCPHSWDWGRGVYQQALLVSSISHMQIITSRKKRPQGRQKKGEVVGDSAGWDHWNIFLWTNMVPTSSGGILALPSATGAGAGGAFSVPLELLNSWGWTSEQVHIVLCSFSTLSIACCKDMEDGNLWTGSLNCCPWCKGIWEAERCGEYP